MPKLANFFHYRNLDVSTIKILQKFWSENSFENVQKQSQHRAKKDIIESINELKFYKKYFFKL